MGRTCDGRDGTRSWLREAESGRPITASSGELHVPRGHYFRAAVIDTAIDGQPRPGK
jgi:hypothetical protein